MNASPEPVSNLLLSLSENALVAGAVWLALAHPLVVLGVGLAALALAVAAIVERRMEDYRPPALTFEGRVVRAALR